jgi:hypothetical protein
VGGLTACAYPVRTTRLFAYFMTTVANCFDLNEALRLKMVLESAGISSFIPDEMTAAVAPHHFLTSSGVRLQVAEEHAVEAQRIIAEERQGS